MKKLKSIRRNPPTEHQEEQLVAWLNEWAVYLEFLDIDPGDSKEVRSRGTNLFDVQPAAGQIRLLPPFSSALKSRPVYIALLQIREDDSFLVAPYGRFAVPATPGELLTGRACAAVRVLCLWNARGLAADFLKSTWLVDEMTPDEMDEAIAVYHNLDSRTVLPGDLLLRTGPPLFHPSDPRRVYLNRESSLWDSILSRIDELDGTRGLTYLPWLEPKKERGETRLAAEEGAVYAVENRFSVKNSNAVIAVSYDDEVGACRFRVQTAGGELCSELNNCRIETPGGHSCTVENCRAMMQADQLRKGFRLTNPAGLRLALIQLN